MEKRGVVEGDGEEPSEIKKAGIKATDKVAGVPPKRPQAGTDLASQMAEEAAKTAKDKDKPA